MRQIPRTLTRNASFSDTFAQRPGPSQDGSPGSKPRSTPASGQTLTAKMLEYRSWWNLPRTKPGKAHP